MIIGENMRVLERRDGGAFSDMWLPSAVLTGIEQWR